MGKFQIYLTQIKNKTFLYKQNPLQNQILILNLIQWNNL